MEYISSIKVKDNDFNPATHKIELLQNTRFDWFHPQLPIELSIFDDHRDFHRISLIFVDCRGRVLFLGSISSIFEVGFYFWGQFRKFFIEKMKLNFFHGFIDENFQ